MPQGAEQRVYRPAGMEAWVLHCTVSGRGEIGRKERRLLVGPGDMMLFPAGVVHDYGWAGSGKPWLHLWATFIPRSVWEPWMAWPESVPGVRTVTIRNPAAHRRVVRRMRQMIAHYRSVEPYHEDLAINALEEVILMGARACGRPATGRYDSRVAELLNWMRTHAHEPLSVETLARRVALSSSRFAHVFRLHTGATPMRFVEQLRVTRAQELLLTTDRAIKNIAFQAGFEDPLHFSHVFRKVVGRSPRRFRGGR